MNRKITASILALLIGASCFVPSDSAVADSLTADSDPESSERLYCVGSVSKVYVTAAIMQLADNGRVNLDAPVTTYIPDFRMADPRYKQITVRMLMNHTSGLFGTQITGMELYDDNYIPPYDVLLESLANQRLKADPGEYASYCNDGFCLLALIVENVTHMSYTDYVVENIAGRIGADQTGTPVNLFRQDNNVPVYAGNLPYDYEYCTDLGSGGIYATASEVAEFGSTFWNGDSRLLTEYAKEEMASRWSDTADEYQDGCGLGWDYVEQLAYEREGVNVLGKGGDITNMHAHLMVAPDNDISVCVLSSGGSSTLNSLVAEILMDVALEEQGITVDHSRDDIEIIDTIPEEFNQYEGFYSLYSMTGDGIAELSFPDREHMQVEVTTPFRTDIYDYRYTSDGGFVKVDDNGNINPDRQVVYLENRNGKTYIKAELSSYYPELGYYNIMTYAGERMEANPVSDEVTQAFETYCSISWVLTGDRYSSSLYDSPFLIMKLYDKCPGYVLIGTGMGSRVEKIQDAYSVAAFTTLPSSANRDIIDAHITPEGTFLASNGLEYIPAVSLPEFDDSVTEVALEDNNPAWYRIGDAMSGGVITIDAPDNSTVSVYNRYMEMTYTTRVLDHNTLVNLPEDGYIMFAGLSGDVVTVS